MCACCHFSRVRLFVALWTVAHQAPLSMGFSRQEDWSGVPCPPPGDLPKAGIEPPPLTSPALAGSFFTTSTTWEAHGVLTLNAKYLLFYSWAVSPFIPMSQMKKWKLIGFEHLDQCSANHLWSWAVSLGNMKPVPYGLWYLMAFCFLYQWG